MIIEYYGYQKCNSFLIAVFYRAIVQKKVEQYV